MYKYDIFGIIRSYSILREYGQIIYVATRLKLLYAWIIIWNYHLSLLLSWLVLRALIFGENTDKPTIQNIIVQIGISC